MNAGEFVAVLKGTADLLEQPSKHTPCPQCQGPTEATHLYCGACGKRLRFACPRCRAECRLGQGFCPACGFALTPEEVRGSEARAALEEEKKRRPSKDILEPFKEVETLREGRCFKLRARRRDSGEPRFLKRIDGAANAELLENEAAVLAAVSHPHLVRLHETHRHQGQLVLEFEYVKTRSWRFPLAIERLCRIMHQVAQALEALHRKGFVHGDVKPPNVLLRDGPNPEEDDAVVCDLEFAQKPGPSRFKAITPLFSAPEQIVGDYFDFRADVYSFGILLYLWFIFDRLPAIVDVESAASRAMGRVLKSGNRVIGTPLHDMTLFEGSAGSTVAWELAKHPELRSRYPASEEEVLGAKFHFGAELERITHINRRLDVTEEILQLVSDATEDNPNRRPANGTALVQRMERILKQLDGPCPIETDRNEPGAASGRSSQKRAVSLSDGPAGEGTFAQQQALRQRLRRVRRGWLFPFYHSDQQKVIPGETPLRTVIVPLAKGQLMRIRSAHNSEGQKLLLNEVEALQAVQHENLLSLRWARRYGPQLLVATSWREIHAPIPVPYPIPWLLTRLAEALRGVAALHRASLVHGDLKPATLLMGDTWTLVSDLKCAAAAGRRAKALFTPKFAAPEQVLGEPVGPEADIYALGMTLYTLFIRARFPLILRGAEGAAKVAPPAEDRSEDEASDMPYLDSDTTVIPSRIPESSVPSRESTPKPSASHGPDFLLGVKVRFHRRLIQVLDAAQHARLVGEILQLVRRATQLNASDRFQSCDEFESAIRRVLDLAHSEAPDTPLVPE